MTTLLLAVSKVGKARLIDAHHKVTIDYSVKSSDCSTEAIAPRLANEMNYSLMNGTKVISPPRWYILCG